MCSIDPWVVKKGSYTSPPCFSL
uniref:Uncharacterized protein n=1 Tax=Anguilla anguilla TaxID=7936 RepID=A0A0E9RVY3_ANGAN